nr:orf immediately downstream of env - feline immunodeficiency virus [Feline immunodeficiency virus]
MAGNVAYLKKRRNDEASPDCKIQERC